MDTNLKESEKSDQNFSLIKEDLINNDSVIEEKKKQENLYYSFYPNGQRITDTLEEITINMKINNNNENKIDFEKIKYKKKEMTYEDFNYPPIEEQEQNNMLFDNK